MFNKVVLVGRLTKDPELRYTSTGKAVVNFGLAVERPFKNKDGEREADFLNIVVWRKQAENCAEHLGKGRLVALDARAQSRSYEDKDGKKRYVVEFVADNVKFLDWPKNKNNGNDNDGIDGFDDDEFSSIGEEVFA